MKIVEDGDCIQEGYNFHVPETCVRAEGPSFVESNGFEIYWFQIEGEYWFTCVRILPSGAVIRGHYSCSGTLLLTESIPTFRSRA